MGKATYRGTVLSGRENFDTWKKDLLNFLRAEDLEEFIDGSAEDPSIDYKGKTAAGSEQVEAVTKNKKTQVKEYRKKESICNRLVDSITLNRIRFRNGIYIMYYNMASQNLTSDATIDSGAIDSGSSSLFLLPTRTNIAKQKLRSRTSPIWDHTVSSDRNAIVLNKRNKSIWRCKNCPQEYAESGGTVLIFQHLPAIDVDIDK
ncbi:MAG: hypothetical protein MMC33_010267 [Icmadophila ericetorum]|nr:hypothetical protein [Icmadophila ericetorum]